MAWMIRHEDGTQAVFIANSGQVFIRDLDGENEGFKLFLTDDKILANEIWRATGADYGEFEIVKVEGEE